MGSGISKNSVDVYLSLQAGQEYILYLSNFDSGLESIHFNFVFVLQSGQSIFLKLLFKVGRG